LKKIKPGATLVCSHSVDIRQSDIVDYTVDCNEQSQFKVFDTGRIQSRDIIQSDT